MQISLFHSHFMNKKTSIVLYFLSLLLHSSKLYVLPQFLTAEFNTIAAIVTLYMADGITLTVYP